MPTDSVPPCRSASNETATLTIHALPHPAYMGLSVSRDQSKVFLTQADHQGSDLWMVDGLR